MRSSAPPMPGMVLPESLIDASRLTTDSARSPTTLTSGRSRPRTTLSPQRNLRHARAHHELQRHADGQRRRDRAGETFPRLARADARDHLVPAEGGADDVRAHVGEFRHRQQVDEQEAVLRRAAGREGEQRHDVEQERHVEQAEDRQRRGGDRRAILLRVDDQPHEGAEQREDQHQLQPEVHVGMPLRFQHEEVPRDREDQRAAEKPALLEDLEAFLLLRAVKLPTGRPGRRARSRPGTRCPSRRKS